MDEGAMIPFSPVDAIAILERTPDVVGSLIGGLPENWTSNNEGPGTWSPYDIVGHFIHGERTDWIPRMEIILSDLPDKRFTPFDRFAQFSDSRGKTLSQLLETFRALRTRNIAILRDAALTASDLEKQGIHPAFGPVTLSQLLATWVAHDLNHIAQIARVMAVQYKADAGPWVAYLRILQG